ncbi:MAG TPA: hypothetical protein VIS99_16175 [Terrimicrobiaceae bacterium]
MRLTLYFGLDSNTLEFVKENVATSASALVILLASAQLHKIEETSYLASHLLLANYDLQTIQKLLGHSDVKNDDGLFADRAELDAEGGKEPAGSLSRELTSGDSPNGDGRPRVTRIVARH